MTTAAGAAEPITVSVEGVVPVEGAGSARDRALAEAMVSAVVAASQRFLPAARFEVEESLAELTETLRDSAPRFVLTYRVDGRVFRRAQAENPDLEEAVLPLTATVDGGQLRDFLRERGLVETAGDQLSIALRVTPAVGLTPPEALGPLAGFEQFLLRRLESSGFVVVEPALRPGGHSREDNAVALARSLGADVALDVRVAWYDRFAESRVVGGVVNVRVRALRADDGVEIARSRFEAPGYHEDREEAVVRALEALGEQVAQNVELQLERNWQALTRDQGPVRLHLMDLTSLLQANAVREALSASLDAERVALVALGPGTAEMQVQIALSPGALQDRLAAVLFDGFRLEPVATSRDRIELRVQPTRVSEAEEPPRAIP
ncbi:MAG: hypothetical protein V3V67_07040 [Myxococcota bacterium]